MTEIIQFENWAKLKLVVGEVKSIGDKIIINDGNKDFEIDFDLNVEKGEQIVIGFVEGEIIIPVINRTRSIIPDDDVELGSRVS